MTPRIALFTILFAALAAVFVYGVLGIIETPIEEAAVEEPAVPAETPVEAAPDPVESPVEAAPVEETAPLEEAVIVEEPKPYHEVELYFATNRLPSGENDPDEPTSQFTSTDDGSTITWGTALVSIPLSHERGQLETQGRVSSWFFEPNPEKYVLLQELTPMTRDDVLGMIRGELASGDSDTSDDILLYVHGFNTSMEKAARRAGQLTFDLEWEGPSVFFSWPSKGRAVAYVVDRSTAERSELPLAEVLGDLASEEADRIVIIAHSLGTQVLTQAMLHLHNTRPELSAKIDTVVLAAPDIDARLFSQQVLPMFQDLRDSTEVTVYASSEDTALKASREVNGVRRLGDSEGGLQPMDPLKLIDATGAESDFFGHTYIGDNVQIVDDVARMILLGEGPEVRETLLGVPEPTGPTWRIRMPGE